ncbi:chitinase, partial [Streptomyces halstedii]|nr:chitinase [Streptomyces halstedii]
MTGIHRSRSRLRALAATACAGALGAALLGVAGTSTAGAAPVTASAATPTAAEATPTAAGGKVVGYFTNWGVYQRDYHVKDIETSGSADKLTHINYAFGNVQGGKCTIG